jgi:hypothetical protein
VLLPLLALIFYIGAAPIGLTSRMESSVQATTLAARTRAETHVMSRAAPGVTKLVITDAPRATSPGTGAKR